MSTRYTSRVGAIGVLSAATFAMALGPSSAVAQAKKSSSTAALNRAMAPTASAMPELHVPGWSKAALANGAQLVVVERHALPLVSVTVNFVGGSNQFEAADKTGLGGM